MVSFDIARQPGSLAPTALQVRFAHNDQPIRGYGTLERQDALARLTP